jgi:fructose transport system permease protein
VTSAPTREPDAAVLELEQDSVAFLRGFATSRIAGPLTVLILAVVIFTLTTSTSTGSGGASPWWNRAVPRWRRQ